MARPIKETPILFGEDARRFEAQMKNCKKDPVLRARVMEAYKIGLEMLKRGEEMQFPKVGECLIK
ncbi:hypothetical protein [Fibrobacter sp. UWEL]|uniref:hypothetical protein n=1 Tax=Fibrobacter sp. UWEL TaxID=1896209 RepID=UPI000916D327|nr:hypothetical protein [Fibrobacter sp. UWEL]SHK83067.1 hypothetical protein SAMN05720468_107131 [Fibrobacter sp. UWEL]